MTQVKEVMFKDGSDAVSRRQRKLAADEEKLEALIKEAKKKGSGEAQSEEGTEEETGTDGGEEETSVKEPVTQEDKDLDPEQRNFKKRYGDLRRHSQAEIDKLKKEVEALKKGDTASVPVEPELVEKWVNDHPQVASIVKKLAEDIADQKLAGANDRFQKLEEEEAKARLSSMESQVLKAHKDFDDLKKNDKFHNWLEDQPEVLQNLVYENTTDAKSLIRVIDLYKTETKKKGPLGAVETRGRSHVTDESGEKKIWKTSEIAGLSSKKFAELEEEITAANIEGRIIQG